MASQSSVKEAPERQSRVFSFTTGLVVIIPRLPCPKLASCLHSNHTYPTLLPIASPLLPNPYLFPHLTSPQAFLLVIKHPAQVPSPVASIPQYSISSRIGSEKLDRKHTCLYNFRSAAESGYTSLTSLLWLTRCKKVTRVS